MESLYRWVEASFNSVLDDPDPVTLEEAEEYLENVKKDKVRTVPEGMTGKYFTKVWNELWEAKERKKKKTTVELTTEELFLVARALDCWGYGLKKYREEGHDTPTYPADVEELGHRFQKLASEARLKEIRG